MDSHGGTVSDSVSALIDEWAHADPSLELSSVDVIQRLRRVRSYLDIRLEENFAAHGLTGTGFGVLSFLIRNPGHELSQRRLSELLMLTPGTISVRIDKLESQGFVKRLPDPDDRRSTIVGLTSLGRQRFDECAPSHLALQERLLAALRTDELSSLTQLLHKLLVSFESHDPTRNPRPFGLVVASAHEARELQRSLGLNEVSGLLVRNVEDESSARNAGIKPGDLLVEVDGIPLVSLVDLAAASDTQSASEVTYIRGDQRITSMLT